MKIVVHASWSEPYRRLSDLTWKRNKLPYCRVHGYIPMPSILPPRDWLDAWGRVREWSRILNSMADGDWLFFSGSDAAITQPSRRIEEFLGDFDFYAGLDGGVIHGDGWICRACPATREMMRWVAASNGAAGKTEQHALAAYLHQGSTDSFLHSIPSNTGEDSWYAACGELLNRSPARLRLVRHTDRFTGDDAGLWPDGVTVPKWSAWTPGHFMLHVGGKTEAERLARLEQYGEPEPASHILLTHYSDEYAELAALTDPSKIEYCRRWKMDYVKIKLDIKSGWERPAFWRSHLDGREGIFFMGADAMITNMDIPPQWHHNLTISLDASGLNNDVFFMRNTPQMRGFLDSLSNWPNRDISEQEAMLLVLTGCPTRFELERRLQVKFEDGWKPASPYMLRVISRMVRGFGAQAVPMRQLQSYPMEHGQTATGWRKGDLCLHATGMPMEQRIAVVKKVLTVNEG